MVTPRKVILTLWLLVSFAFGFFYSVLEVEDLFYGFVAGLLFLVPFGIIAYVILKIWEAQGVK